MTDKTAQFNSVGSKSIQDLYLAIMMDTGISYTERQALVAKLDELFDNAGPGTPLQSVMFKLTGAGLGFLVGKYFKLGALGQGVLAATGVGLGTLINNRMSQRHVSTLYNSFNQ